MNLKNYGKSYIVRVSAAAAALLLLLLLVIVPGIHGFNADPLPDPDGNLSEPVSANEPVSTDEPADAVAQNTSLGMCPVCYTGVYELDLYVECRNCFEFIKASGEEFSCGSCGTNASISLYTEDDYWMDHDSFNCNSLVWYPWFVSYNSGSGRDIDMSAYLTKIVKIKAEFDQDKTFSSTPWYSYMSPPSSLTANIKGEYQVYIYGSRGERLAFACFDAVDKFRAVSAEGSVPVGGIIPVEVVIRFNEEAAKIVIMKDDLEIYSRDVSKHTPEVEFIGFDEDQYVQDKITVNWKASDADGDELYFELWYCVNETDYYLLAADIKETSFEADLTNYPGKKNAYFYIYATDGVRTAEARSPFVNVKYTPPQILTEQNEIPKIKITEEIYFPTKIYDAQDGWLSGNSVSWMLEGEEVSITSVLQSWPYQLNPGLHTFTCIATNSAGLSAQKDFTFEIVNDESDLPDDWSRQEIIHALKEGYIIPLDRIDSPVARGQFADLMFMLFYYMNPEGLPYYDKDFIKDCGDNDYSEFMMAYLGLMDAPGGVFEPFRSMSQRDALRIMYQTWMLAANPDMVIKDIVYDEKKALKSFIDNGIFDKSENIYSPDEKLSKKSALVWVSRMDRWVFPEE